MWQRRCYRNRHYSASILLCSNIRDTRTTPDQESCVYRLVRRGRLVRLARYFYHPFVRVLELDPNRCESVATAYLSITHISYMGRWWFVSNSSWSVGSQTRVYESHYTYILDHSVHNRHTTCELVHTCRHIVIHSPRCVTPISTDSHPWDSWRFGAWPLRDPADTPGDPLIGFLIYVFFGWFARPPFSVGLHTPAQTWRCTIPQKTNVCTLTET